MDKKEAQDGTTVHQRGNPVDEVFSDYELAAASPTTCKDRDRVRAISRYSILRQSRPWAVGIVLSMQSCPAAKALQQIPEIRKWVSETAVRFRRRMGQ